MNLEGIKEWRETLLERITPIAVMENVDWLIAEVGLIGRTVHGDDTPIIFR